MLTGCESEKISKKLEAEHSQTSSDVGVSLPDPIWSHAGVECFDAGYNANLRKSWSSLIAKADQNLSNKYVDNMCRNAKGEMWFSVFDLNTDNPIDMFQMIHLSGTGMLLDSVPGFSSSGGDIVACPIIAWSPQEHQFLIECSNGDGGWGFTEIFEYDILTRKRKNLMTAFEIVSAQAYEFDEAIKITDKDRISHLQGCNPITRDAAKRIQQEIRSTFLHSEIVALDKICPVENSMQIATFVIEKEGKIDRARSSGIALFSETGALIEHAESFASGRVPSRFVQAPTLVRMQGGRYFFLTEVQQEKEKHLHFLEVNTVNRGVYMRQTEDHYSDPIVCEKWSICGEE